MQNIIDSVHTSNKDTYRSDFHHQISVRCCRLRSYMVTVTVACVLVFLTISENKKTKNKNKKARYFFAIVDLILLLVCLSLLQQIVSTTVTQKKIINWKPSSGRSQFQLSGLCGPQFHAETFHAPLQSFVWRRYISSYCYTVLVHQYGRRKSTKTSGVHFFYKSSFLSLENQHTYA